MARETVLYAVPHDSCGMNGGPSAAYYFAVYITYIQHDGSKKGQITKWAQKDVYVFNVFLFPKMGWIYARL